MRCVFYNKFELYIGITFDLYNLSSSQQRLYFVFLPAPFEVKSSLCTQKSLPCLESVVSETCCLLAALSFLLKELLPDVPHRPHS